VVILSAGRAVIAPGKGVALPFLGGTCGLLGDSCDRNYGRPGSYLAVAQQDTHPILINISQIWLGPWQA
jgi:hypothetical protein